MLSGFDPPGCGAAVTVDCNCYAPLADYVDFSRCRKIGFKAVQARVVWHGMYGFNSIERAGVDYYPWSNNSPGGINMCRYEPFHPGPDGIKYLHMDATATYTTDQGTTSDSRSVTVDRWSGIKTQTCEASSPVDIQLYSKLCDLTSAAWATDLMSFFEAARGDMVECEHCKVTVTGSGSAMHADMTEQFLLHTDPNTGAETWSGPVTTYSADVSKGSFTYDNYLAWVDDSPNPGTLHGPYHVRHTEISVSATVLDYQEYFNFDAVLDPPPAPVPPNEAWHIHAELSQPFTSDQVVTELYRLLGEWNLTDDAQYPWRFADGYVAISPLVEHYGYPDVRTPTIEYSESSPASYTDPETLPKHHLFDGHVIGAPNPAGYAAQYDWHYTDTAVGDGTPLYGTYTPGFLPSNAPHFTDWWLAQLLWPGAWIWQQAGKGIVMAQKWAEIKIHRPAMNFARPYGLDRFAIEIATRACGVSWDGATRLLTIDQSLVDAQGAALIHVGDLVLVTGDNMPIGVFPVTAVNTPSTYTLGDLKWDLPGNIRYLPGFGKIRWPKAWAIEGRVAVKSMSTNGTDPLAITLEQDAEYLRTGDKVDFVDANDNSVLGWNDLPVSVTDTRHLAIPAHTDAPSGSNLYLKSSGAPHYWWFDDESKGDYLVGEWMHDFRDIGEADRICHERYQMNYNGCSSMPDMPDGVTCIGDGTSGSDLRVNQMGHGMPRSVKNMSIDGHCLPFSPCHPQVVCISPNGEQFPLGTTYPFPGSVTADATGMTVDSTMLTADSGFLPLDDRYGTLWQSMPIFWMQDPFWEAPPKPCPKEGDDGDDDEGWTEDVLGNCADTAQYEHRPLVEARSSVPAPWKVGDRSPTLPDDVIINVLNLHDLDTPGAPPSGVVIAPPDTMEDGAKLNLLFPWSLWLAEVHCVCGGGKFEEQYKENGVSVDCPK